MKTYIRKACQELEALGFQYDEDTSMRGKRAYRHPYEPETILKLWDGASESACITIVRKAHDIAGLSNQGPKLPTTLKERADALKLQQRARRAREVADYQNRVATVEMLERDEVRRRQLYAISQLMGAGRPRTF